MSNCAVATCKNYSKITKGTDIKYFRFPKNDDLAKQWIVACRREGTMNLKNARVCSIHFEVSCFEVSLQQRLLGYKPIRSRHLKLDAVPTLSIPKFQKMPRIDMPSDVISCDKDRANMRRSMPVYVYRGQNVYNTII